MLIIEYILTQNYTKKELYIQMINIINGYLTSIIKNLFDNRKRNQENNPVFMIKRSTYEEVENQICYFSRVDNTLYHSIFAQYEVFKLKISNDSKNPAYDVDIDLGNEIIHVDYIEGNKSVFIIPNLYNSEELDKKFEVFFDYYREYHDIYKISGNDDLRNKYVQAKTEVIKCFSSVPNIITISCRNTLGTYHTMSFELNKENIGKDFAHVKNNHYLIKSKMRKTKKKRNLAESAHANITEANKFNPIIF